MNSTAPDHVAQIIADAGGQIVGRTRLQKIAYLLTAAGFEDCFQFEYKHYGPFSDALVEAAQVGELFGVLTEEERSTQWGGTYYVFRTDDLTSGNDQARNELIEIGSKADAVELELAATAIFLASRGHSDPWSETARRKPEKVVGDRLQKAKALYNRLNAVSTPIPLPNL